MKGLQQPPSVVVLTLLRRRLTRHGVELPYDERPRRLSQKLWSRGGNPCEDAALPPCVELWGPARRCGRADDSHQLLCGLLCSHPRRTEVGVKLPGIELDRLVSKVAPIKVVSQDN